VCDRGVGQGRRPRAAQHPRVCRRCYIHPQVLDAFERGITLTSVNGKGSRPLSRRKIELAVLRMLDAGETTDTRVRRAS